MTPTQTGPIQAGTDGAGTGPTRPAEPAPEAVAPPGTTVRRSRWWAWGPPAALFAAAVAAHVVLARHMYTPIIHADEFGYLMGAHFMARGGSPIGQPYYPGYSSLLVPLWWLSSHTTTVYRWALDANAVLAGFTVVLLYLLARRLAPRAGPLAWTGAVVVVGAYPALVLYSELAESENLLVPGFLGVCLLLLRALERPRAGRWALAAGAAGLLYAVHGRALAVAAAVALTAAWVLRPWRRWRSELLAAAVALMAALGVSQLWIHWVTRAVPGHQLPPTASGSPGLVTRVTTGSGLTHVGVILGGQGLYLLAAAAPLLVLGVAALLRAARRPRLALLERGWGTFLLLCLAAGALVAAVFLATGTRLDDAMYGRYVEVFAVPVLLVGALAAARLRSPAEWWARPWRAVILGTAVIAALAAGVYGYWGATLHGPVVRTNAFGMADLFWGPNPAARVSVLVVAGVAAGALVVVLGAYRLAPVLGVVLAVGAFVAPTVRAYGDVVDQSAAAVLERDIPATLQAMELRFGPLPCASWDSTLPDAWGFYNTRLFSPDMDFPVFDSARGQLPPCPDGVVVSGRGFGSLPSYRGARQVVQSNATEAVWIAPGALQERMGRAGWLLPLGFPGPLPASAAAGSLTVVSGLGAPYKPGSPASLTVPRRGSHDLVVRVTNRSTGAPWPDATSIGPVPKDAVRVAVAWYRGPATQADIVAAARADLPVSLVPGQSVDVDVKLAPLGLGTTVTVPKYLPAGRYSVEVFLIQEGVASWEATISPIWLNVTVPG